MAKFFNLSAMLFVSALLFPTFSMAEDVSKVTLNNQSKTSDVGGGYYLEHAKTFGENNCVEYRGSKKVMPGGTTFFEMKKDCPWGGVDFKVHKVKSDQYIGILSYVIRDGSASMEMKIKCKNDSECVFHGVMPEK